MNILVLNGSPRPKGNTKQMVEAFREGALASGHQVSIVDVCRKKNQWLSGMRTLSYQSPRRMYSEG